MALKPLERIRAKISNWKPIKDMLRWGRAWSLWWVHYETGCCCPEIMSVSYTHLTLPTILLV